MKHKDFNFSTPDATDTDLVEHYKRLCEQANAKLKQMGVEQKLLRSERDELCKQVKYCQEVTLGLSGLIENGINKDFAIAQLQKQLSELRGQLKGSCGEEET